MKAIQADVTLLDAEVFVPYITGALDERCGAGRAGRARGTRRRPARRRGRRAARRLELHDADRRRDRLRRIRPRTAPARRPRPTEVAHSIAATIYSVWRGQAIRNGVDRTLTGLGRADAGFRRGDQGTAPPGRARRHRPVRRWISSAGPRRWPHRSRPAPRLRDAQEPADALDRLAGPAFAAAFKGSTNQDDYRWGRLHRIVFDGLAVGGPFGASRARRRASRRRSRTCADSRWTAVSASWTPRRTAARAGLERRVHVRQRPEPPLRRRARHGARARSTPRPRCRAA